MFPSRYILVAGLALTVAAALPDSVQAREIERACLASGRTSSQNLCRCIQGVADQLLTGREQRLAATFFADPHRAQEVRMSDRSRDEQFWQRYKQFGSVATARCG